MAFNEVLTILMNITSIAKIIVDVYILTLFPFVSEMQKRKLWRGGLVGKKYKYAKGIGGYARI